MKFFLTLFFIFIFSVVSVYAKKQKNDSLFNFINTKEINEMTDGEYRFFREYINDNDIEFGCNNPRINSLQEKSIIEMSDNEYEFFAFFIFDCDKIDPCTLKQFTEIKDKNNYDMTNNEYEWIKNAKDECEDYAEKFPNTRRGKITRRMKLISLFVVVPAVIIGTGIFVAYYPGSKGPE